MTDRMACRQFTSADSTAVIGLFQSVFTSSEGEHEGQTIEKLVADLIETTPREDLTGFIVAGGNEILGCIFFSRFTLPVNRVAFLLSPVAVRTDCQSQGLGKSLICHGLDAMAAAGTDIVVTYGDPAYYGQVGFQPINEQIIPAPYPLSQPHGWQALSFNKDKLTPLSGQTVCVPAFSNPLYW